MCTQPILTRIRILERLANMHENAGDHRRAFYLRLRVEVLFNALYERRSAHEEK